MPNLICIHPFLKMFLLKKFSRICCLLFSYQCSLFLLSQATALIDYHIFCRLSTTFLFFLFRFCDFLNHFQATACLLYHIQQPFVKNFFQVFLCIFHLALSISRQGCPVFSILHRLSQRRRLSYHLAFKLSTFFLFFI